MIIDLYKQFNRAISWSLKIFITAIEKKQKLTKDLHGEENNTSCGQSLFRLKNNALISCSRGKPIINQQTTLFLTCTLSLFFFKNNSINILKVEIKFSSLGTKHFEYMYEQIYADRNWNYGTDMTLSFRLDNDWIS